MPTARLDHIIYAPIPYKGYGIRAWSTEEKDDFRRAANDWFVPVSQAKFKGDYEVRVVSRVTVGKIYLSRIFGGSRLDELKREGVVCHMVAIPQELFAKGLTFEAVEKAMILFQGTHGVPIGKMEALEVSWEERQEDPELERLRALVPKEYAKKILEGFDKRYAKILVVYRKNPWDRMKLLYSISKMLLLHGLQAFTAISDRPMHEVVVLFSNLLIISDEMIPVRSKDEWTIVNLSKIEATRGEGKSSEDTLAKIYNN